MKWKFWKRNKVPNPGTREAALAGCTCPIHINNAGREKPKGGWSTRSNCPLHASWTKKVKVRD